MRGDDKNISRPPPPCASDIICMCANVAIDKCVWVCVSIFVWAPVDVRTLKCELNKRLWLCELQKVEKPTKKKTTKIIINKGKCNNNNNMRPNVGEESREKKWRKHHAVNSIRRNTHGQTTSTLHTHILAFGMTIVPNNWEYSVCTCSTMTMTTTTTTTAIETKPRERKVSIAAEGKR